MSVFSLLHVHKMIPETAGTSAKQIHTIFQSDKVSEPSRLFIADVSEKLDEFVDNIQEEVKSHHNILMSIP